MNDFPYVRTRDVDTPALLGRLATEKPGVTVVVAVFNGGDVVQRCLDSLASFTPNTVRIVVIDDASTDPGTLRLLADRSAAGAIELVTHPENWGYTRTANHGLELAGTDDVVLLNSDTEVGPMWLHRLAWTAYTDSSTGTVSAVSNDAAANSLPRRHARNDWYPRLPWHATARLMMFGMRVWSQVVPAAHGFCMYVRRTLLDDVGGFDVDAFPSGYGEEVDLSQRAIRAGWNNLVAPHVMVRHHRSQSFGDRRQKLVADSKVVLGSRYPELVPMVALWQSSVGALLTASNASWIRTSWCGGEPLERRVAVRPRGSRCDLDVVDWHGRPVPADMWAGDLPTTLAEVPVGDAPERIVRLLLTHGAESVATPASLQRKWSETADLLEPASASSLASTSHPAPA